MPESKLKSKMDKYPVPDNCPDVSPPTLNNELTDKGYVDRATKKSDGRIVNVQNDAVCRKLVFARRNKLPS